VRLDAAQTSRARACWDRLERQAGMLPIANGCNCWQPCLPCWHRCLPGWRGRRHRGFAWEGGRWRSGCCCLASHAWQWRRGWHAARFGRWQWCLLQAGLHGRPDCSLT
jgi:hypothetical protein